MKAFLLDYLLERTYLPWLSTQEQGASLVGRTVRRSRARKLKLTGSSSEWDSALLPPHGKGNYTPAKGDRNALWLTPVYMRLVTTRNCLQTLLTNPCRCPGRNSAAGIYFHPEENTLSWTAEARQTVYIWERIKSQLSTEDLQDSVEIWNRSHKVSGNMTGSHLSQLYLLVPIAQLPKKGFFTYPSVISQGSKDMQKLSQKMKGKLLSQNQLLFESHHKLSLVQVLFDR